MLLPLSARPHSLLYSQMVWQVTSALHKVTQLPYHRFRQGDNVLLSRLEAEVGRERGAFDGV